MPFKSQGYNPLFDPATDNLPIDPEIQKMLNKPLVDDSGFSQEDQAFLQQIIAKFEEGTIHRYEPSSLLNVAVYDSLDTARKGKADQNAFNILSTLRNIYDLWTVEQSPTYQVKNMIHSIRLTKERLETELGDVYIV